ncbi:MAG TPA: sigma-70 family RNA polymerase sigma factor [Terriglobales bacterium]|jgi:RNA polymerase sigma-70 factor (ECF subfamily)
MAGAAHPASTLRGQLEPLLNHLHQQSGAAKYGIAAPEFAGILVAIAAKYLPEDASEADIRELYLTLRTEELAIARACAAGNEQAWQTFMIRYREKLHDAALAITREDSQARELAGSIYADLYGSTDREGKRVSKLTYYNGRGSLEGWLRTVLAQRHVNDYRSERRTVSLEAEGEEGKQFSAPEPEPVASVDPRLNSTTAEVLAAISAEDRCILAYYFLDDLTLAKIGRILGVHESTISRRLEKLVKGLRKDIVLGLTRKGMSRRQAEEALDVDVRDLQVDIRRHLTQDSGPAAFSKEKAVRAGETPE